MTENNGFSFGIGIGLGILIGGFFAYLILKSSTQQTPQLLQATLPPSTLEKLYIQKLETRLTDEMR